MLFTVFVSLNYTSCFVSFIVSICIFYDWDDTSTEFVNIPWDLALGYEGKCISS